MCSTELTCSSFEFTILKEMCVQRNSSCACVHFNNTDNLQIYVNAIA